MTAPEDPPTVRNFDRSIATAFEVSKMKTDELMQVGLEKKAGVKSSSFILAAATVTTGFVFMWFEKEGADTVVLGTVIAYIGSNGALKVLDKLPALRKK